jgi:hypothetical protein
LMHWQKKNEFYNKYSYNKFLIKPSLKGKITKTKRRIYYE